MRTYQWRLHAWTLAAQWYTTLSGKRCLVSFIFARESLQTARFDPQHPWPRQQAHLLAAPGS